MKKLSPIVLIPVLALFANSLLAGGETHQSELEDLEKVEYQSMLEEAERARQEAEAAHRGAVKAAEMARETARMNTEIARERSRLEAEGVRESSQHRRQESEQRRQERAVQEEEMARVREELGKAHRELREATREVARAHRDLGRTDHVREISYHVNLGDRAVIGVVLGRETDKGVPLIGISPDGPAERAGLQQGDILMSIRGVDLADNDRARQAVFEVMEEVADGEELAVVVERDGESWEYAVVAEHREPRSWQSVVRIPDVEAVVAAAAEQAMVIERIEVPQIDEEALVAQMEELSEKLEASQFVYITSDSEDSDEHEHSFEFEFEEFSELGGHAMSEAKIWYGLPRAHGLELTSINEGLGAYFKTDRGVLVINAKEDNGYQLQSGDVILSIGPSEVNSPSDMMRALRDVDPGSEIEIAIKRDRRDKTLSVVVPENRLGFR